MLTALNFLCLQQRAAALGCGRGPSFADALGDRRQSPRRSLPAGLSPQSTSPLLFAEEINDWLEPEPPYATGSLLMRLLHVTGGAVAVGGAIVLAILAIGMAAGPSKKVKEMSDVPEDPKQIAVHPSLFPSLRPHVASDIGRPVRIARDEGGQSERNTAIQPFGDRRTPCRTEQQYIRQRLSERTWEG